MKKNAIPRCYFVAESEDGEGGAVVALNGKDAKKIYFQSYNVYGEWTDLRVRWLRKVDVSDLMVGIQLDPREGLKRGAYVYVNGEECPICGEDDICLYFDGERFGCEKCLPDA